MQQPKAPEVRAKLAELIVVLVAALTPMFILANEVDGDEFVKAGSGAFSAVAAALVLGVYRVWKGQNAKGHKD